MEQKEKEQKQKLEKLKEQFSKSSQQKRPNPNGGGPGKKFNFYWIYTAIFLVFIGLSIAGNFSNTALKTDFRTFTNMLDDNDVEKIKIINNRDIQVFIKKEVIDSRDRYREISERSVGGIAAGPHFQFEMPGETFERHLESYYERNPPSSELDKIIPIYEERKNYWGDIIAWTFPFLIMIAIWIFIMRRMSAGGAGPGSQIFNIGKSRAQVFDKDTKVKVTFEDVAGMEGSKEEVEEIVDFLKNPGRYTNLGGKIPKGVLLAGPPGTGKTLLAKAVAGEAKVPFFSLSGSDFVEMFVGVGASRVRDLFKQAKEKSPAIIFIDEIDAIGRSRGKNNFSGGNDERENTLNQLLTEMDGFGTNEHVIVMAATNRADILDRALTRAGRFDRIVYVDLPDLNERAAIFKVHLKKIKTADKLDLSFLAKQTPGFSGADIANVCNEAALIAARKEKKSVDKQDFLDAVDRIVGGLEKKSKIITPNEKKVIAFHEAGHATVSWMTEHASPLIKVTIVPRGKSLGAAWYLPDERQLTNTEQMLDEMAATLGGRAAEEIVFGKISTGALSDLEKVTKQARAMVTIYGLNEKLGNITYYDSSGQNEFGFNRPYSEKTAQLIDEEIHELIENQYKRAKQILEDNKDKLTLLAERLLEKEVIFKEDLVKIFGKRPYEQEVEQAPILETEAHEVASTTEDTSVSEGPINAEGEANDSSLNETDAAKND
jgi:ATP-dependent metalloprotease FtsH